jgi:hypothetical protein
VTDETTTVRLVYAGQRDGDKRLFYIEGQEDTTEGARAYSKKVRGTAIGGVYTIEATDEQATSVYGGTLTYVGSGLAVDRDTVARWQLLDREARGQVDRDKAERRLAKSDELDDVMAPCSGSPPPCGHAARWTP